MERRAIVIRTVGDPEIAGAIVDGMNNQVTALSVEEMAAVRREFAKLEAWQGTRRYRQRRDWKNTRMALARKYHVRKHSAAYEHLLVAWALMWLVIFECYHRLSLWNRRPR